MKITAMNFDASRLEISPTSRTIVGVSAYDVDGSTVLENFEINHVISHFGIADLLSEIGEQEARRHFDIEG